MSRTDAVVRAVVAELQRRRAIIDSSDSLIAISVSVKLQEGPVPVRAVTYEDQQLVTRRGGRELDCGSAT